MNVAVVQIGSSEAGTACVKAWDESMWWRVGTSPMVRMGGGGRSEDQGCGRYEARRLLRGA